MRKKLANPALCGRVSPQANIEPSAGDVSNGPAKSNVHPYTKNETDTPLREPSPKQKALLRYRREQDVALRDMVPKAKFDAVDLAWFYRETMARLSHYQRRVNQGKDLEAAQDFCSYVFNAGMEKLFHYCGEGSTVDPVALTVKRKELEYQIHESWRTCKVLKKYDEGEMDAMNRKVDMLVQFVESLAKQGELPSNVVRLLGPSKG